MGTREPTKCTKCGRIIDSRFIERAEAKGLYGTFKWYKIPSWRLLGTLDAERDTNWGPSEALRNLHPWCQRKWKNLYWIHDSLWEIPERRNRNFGLAKWICDIEQLSGEVFNLARVSSIYGRCSYIPPIHGWIWDGPKCEAWTRVYPSGDDYYLLYKATDRYLQGGNQSAVLTENQRICEQRRRSIYRLYRDGRKRWDDPYDWFDRVIGWDDAKWHYLEDAIWDIEQDIL